MDKNNVSDINFITYDEILRIHEHVINRFGGDKGIILKSNLEFLVEFIKIQYYDIKFENIFLISSIILWYIIIGHPFVDGNKRTGIESVDLFLIKNGYYLDFTAKEGIDFTLSIARNEEDMGSIYYWIKNHSKKL